MDIGNISFTIIGPGLNGMGMKLHLSGEAEWREQAQNLITLLEKTLPLLIERPAPNVPPGPGVPCPTENT